MKSSAGKGDDRRPQQVSDAEFSRRWALTFGDDTVAEEAARYRSSNGPTKDTNTPCARVRDTDSLSRCNTEGCEGEGA